jgi:hypothetical protein
MKFAAVILRNGGLLVSTSEYTHVFLSFIIPALKLQANVLMLTAAQRLLYKGEDFFVFGAPAENSDDPSFSTRRAPRRAAAHALQLGLSNPILCRLPMY